MVSHFTFWFVLGAIAVLGGTLMVAAEGRKSTFRQNGVVSGFGSLFVILGQIAMGYAGWYFSITVLRAAEIIIGRQ